MAIPTGRPSYTLTGDNIVEHIHTQQELEHQTRNYFHFSPLWRAIQDHISNNKLKAEGRNDLKKVVLVDVPWDYREEEGDYLGIRSYRGSGCSISFKDVAIYGMRGEAENLEMDIEIEWENSYESFPRKHHLKIPVALCKVADDDLPRIFDEWIETLRKEVADAKREKDAQIFRRIIKEYPVLNADECQKVLNKILKDEDY